MGEVDSKVRRTRSRLRLLGLAFALVVHIVLVGALAWGARRDPDQGLRAPLDVQLVPIWMAAPEPPATVRLKTRRISARPNLTTSVAKTATTSIPSSTVVQASPFVSPGAALTAPTINPRLGMALRGSVIGCSNADAAGFTSAERQHCRDMFAANRSAASDYSRFAVDPEKRAAFDAAAKRALILQQPFLAESPKNGCRPLVAHHDYTVGGQSRPENSIVIGCGKSF